MEYDLIFYVTRKPYHDCHIMKYPDLIGINMKNSLPNLLSTFIMLGILGD